MQRGSGYDCPKPQFRFHFKSAVQVYILLPARDKLKSDDFFNGNNVTRVNRIASSSIRVDFNDFHQWALMLCLPYLKAQNWIIITAWWVCHIYQDVIKIKSLFSERCIECFQGLILFPIVNISHAQNVTFVHTWDQSYKTILAVTYVIIKYDWPLICLFKE